VTCCKNFVAPLDIGSIRQSEQETISYRLNDDRGLRQVAGRRIHELNESERASRGTRELVQEGLREVLVDKTHSVVKSVLRSPMRG
jgi:hypothetical protein